MFNIVKKLVNWIKKEDKEWKKLIEQQFNDVYDFSEWFAKVYIKWKWFNFIDENKNFLSKI